MKCIAFWIPVYCLVILVSCSHSNSVTEHEQPVSGYDAELKPITEELLNDPQNAALHHSRAQIHLKYKHFEEAEVDAKLALRYDSTQANYALTLIDILFYQNKTRQVKDLLLAVQHRYANPELYLKLAELYLLIRSYQDAINAVNAALKIDAQLAKAYFLKANIYRESGDTAKAISSYETALEQNPQLHDAQYDLGLIYAAKLNPLALTYFERVIQAQSNDSLVRYAYAYTLQNLNRPAEALQAYKALVTQFPNYADAHYNLGAMYFAITACKDLNKALDCFSTVIKLQPQSTPAYLARAYVYKALKNTKAAALDFKWCLQIDPSNTEAAQGLNELKP